MAGYDLTGNLIFAIVTTITPGPNNLLLFAHGKNHGFRDSGKLMSGIFLGFFTMLCMTGYGIAGIIVREPVIGFALKILSSIWLFILAVSMIRLDTDIGSGSGKKIGFLQGYLLQFVNPKAWIISVAAAGAFLPDFDNIHLSVLAFALVFNLAAIPSMITWISFGDIISRILKSGKSNQWLGILLFVLMGISIIMIWLE
jgi:threonine/homoserine/homoserine lactone efflux protein